MRKSLLLLALLMVGCGGGGSGTPSGGGSGLPVEHVPQISGFTMSPNSALYMEGGGATQVSALLNFRDTGRDVHILSFLMPDGDLVAFDQFANTETGTLSENFLLPTDTLGSFKVEVWVVDEAGRASNHLFATFDVTGTASTGDWTGRVTGLPFVLNDVLWNGDRFVAIGRQGKIMTSADGVAWSEHDSPTGFDLNAIAAQGSDLVAVGDDATVLLSTDGGQNWQVKHTGDRVRLAGVAISPTQIVTGGMDLRTGDAFMMRSVDRGATWNVLATLPQTGHFITDIVYANGRFVAGTDVFSPESDTRVMVSTDGQNWADIVLRNEVADLAALLHDGSRFVAAGGESAVFVSADGYNWSERHTPVAQVSYLSAAWNGSELVVAGGITWWYWWLGTPPAFERPVGLSSTDGGVTWEMFDIDGYYQSRGLAWGNGRFVSVGQTTPISGKGAIYTSP